LGLKRNEKLNEQQKKRIRLTVHVCFAILFFIAVMIFKWIDNKSIIDFILKVANYTYGPLLALFSFGIFTKRRMGESYGVLIVCIAAPALCYLLNWLTQTYTHYQIGFELLLINALITFAGLLMISKKQ
ncbi:MAG TPA: sodium:solute symporter, partial [Chitinophagaceae bacterium]|nr:sodium:solute symporter [Chitinophagaceae bacterium]